MTDLHMIIRSRNRRSRFMKAFTGKNLVSPLIYLMVSQSTRDANKCSLFAEVHL